MHKILGAVLAALLFASLPAFAARQALVIGNDSYRTIAPLKNARADARAIATELEDAGFKVVLALDLDRSRMNAALRRFKNGLTGGDEAVFFYAGHGVQLGGANYLLPVDINGEDEDQIKDDGVHLQRVLDDFAEQKTRFSLAIIDACRDNPFKGKGRNFATRGLAPTTAASGQMVIFSAGAGQQALDRLGDADTSPNGLFTRLLVREIGREGQSVDRALKNVRTEVVRLAKSVGHEQVPAIYDQATGEYYFRPSRSNPSAGTAVSPAPATSAPGEIDLWRSVERGNTPAEYDVYLAQYPKGTFTELARARKAQLLAAQQPPAESASGSTRSRTDPASFEVGSRVLGQWSDSWWYPATITARSGQAFSLAFDDGDRADVPRERLRALDWAPGRKVACNWKGGGRYYPGVIKTASGPNLFINYDDGDVEQTTQARCRER